jgi:hypothetical protein
MSKRPKWVNHSQSRRNAFEESDVRGRIVRLLPLGLLEVIGCREAGTAVAQGRLDFRHYGHSFWVNGE